MPTSEEGLLTLLRESGIEQDSDICRHLQSYLSLLIKWNSRINLTSSTEWGAIAPLFQEGLWASEIYPPDGFAHLDIGSGAGFPAVILKAMRPKMRLDLVESRSRKGIFLETVVQTLGWRDVRVHAARLQTFLLELGEEKSWDCISWKALKLGNEDIRKLLMHTHPDTQFWMFHGSGLALEEPSVARQYFKLLRSERFPGRIGWYLSIYVPR